MYVCMYVCMYVYVYACKCVYVSIYVCIYVCVYVCTYVYMYVYIYECKYVCMCGPNYFLYVLVINLVITIKVDILYPSLTCKAVKCRLIARSISISQLDCKIII